MKCIMTFVAGSDSALLRDMIDHHSLQGVDTFLIADSGASVDVSKTLDHYCGRGDVFLHGIAGLTTDEWDSAELLAHGAFAHHGATCVLSAGTGDFWVATDRGQTLRQVLEEEHLSSRDSLVPLAGTDSGVPATRLDRRIRWDTTASAVSEDRPAVATRIEAYRRASAAEPAPEARRILQQLNEARFQRSVDLANEAESLRAELQRMRARKIVRLADRVHGFLVNARARQRHSAARVLTLPTGVLSRWRSERARAVSLRSNVIRRRAVTRLLTLGLPGAIENGSPGTAALPVVMCLWNRPQRIDTMLESLARQSTDRKLRVILWNNAPQDSDYYRERVRGFRRRGALDSIELISNPVNIGGMARFVVARTLWEQGLRGPFIMVDDDQDLNESFVDDSLAGYEAHSINAWWAFRNHGSHWNRSELDPGETADYGGTGGAAVDLAIVEDLDFFDIPVRYFMLEDQWMSHYAHARGWTIRKSSAQITAVLEETNQYHALRELKDEFFTLLHP